MVTLAGPLRRWTLVIPLAVAVATIASGAAPAIEARSLRRYEATAPHMGTLCRVVLYSADEAAAAAAARAALEEIGELSDRLSDYRHDSEVSRLGRASGGPPVAVSPDLWRILTHARALAGETGGAFDVTVGPLSQVWRRARRHSSLPTSGEIAEARALVDWRKVALDPRHRTARLEVPGMRLDLGGIAKGYAADVALARLVEQGFTRALVAIGGDIAVGAPPPDEPGWTVAVAGLDDPGSPASPPLVVEHAAVSTSGDAEQALVVNGVRYSHIIDPRSGQAIEGRASVSVIARTGLEADSLATAASVLEPSEGLALFDAHDAAGLIVRAGGPAGERVEVYASARWPHVPEAARADPGVMLRRAAARPFLPLSKEREQ